SSSFFSSTPGKPEMAPPMKLSFTVKLISIRWLAGSVASVFLRISTETPRLRAGMLALPTSTGCPISSVLLLHSTVPEKGTAPVVPSCDASSSRDWLPVAAADAVPPAPGAAFAAFAAGVLAGVVRRSSLFGPAWVCAEGSAAGVAAGTAGVGAELSASADCAGVFGAGSVLVPATLAGAGVAAAGLLAAGLAVGCSMAAGGVLDCSTAGAALPNIASKSI